MSQTRSEERIQAALIRLDEAWSRLTRQISADIKEYPLSIPLSQVYLLRLLDRRGALTMTALANSLGVTLSGCTAVVDRAVEAGWVERKRDPADRRVVLVGVSPAGERALDEVRQTRARIFARYLTRLEPDEIETLTDLLSRVAEAAALDTTVTA
ncbi:MAG TPA: MarR family transcriptional regulator [Anaerolineae bacterium]|jgi:DNA-binding MarR family transcriptional regulator